MRSRTLLPALVIILTVLAPRARTQVSRRLSQVVVTVDVDVVSYSFLTTLNASALTNLSTFATVWSVNASIPPVPLVPGLSNASACPAGYACGASLNGSLLIASCPGMTYRPPGLTPTSLCPTCPPGSYCVTPHAARATPCPAGTFGPYAGATSATSCVTCPAHTVCPPGSVVPARCVSPAGSYCPNATSSPVPCPPGAAAAANQSSCGQCAAGSSAPGGSGSCASCRPGTYASSGGMASCAACPNGTFTFTSSGGAYTVVWGAASPSQCVATPSAPSPLACVPGTYMVGAACVVCPVGYYCPLMSSRSSQPGAVRACPAATRCTQPGGLDVSDCGAVGPVTVLPYNTCAMGATLPAGYSGLSIVAVAAPKASDRSTFFATATAVYRLLLTTMSLQFIAGAEGTPGNAQGLYSDARFTSISAIAVDLDAQEATVVVIGDAGAHTVTFLDLVTRQVTLVGGVGAVSRPGGIALRRDPSTLRRVAYVTDVTGNSIVAFDIDAQTVLLVAGSIYGAAGYADGPFTANIFNAPAGVAFLESDLDTNRMLVVADTGNARIRVLDTLDRSVLTWFAPLDLVSPEMVAPTSVSAVHDNSGDVLVYVTDTGFTPPRLSVLAYPFRTDTSVRTLTPLTLPPDAGSVAAVIPDPSIVLGSFYDAAQAKFVYLDGAAHTLRSQLLNTLAAANTVGGQCVYPCDNGGCNVTVAALCGNFFLDAGEQCDEGADFTDGCLPGCVINTTGWACPGDAATCLAPCKAYYHQRVGSWHCTAECLAQTPAAGYAMDAQCNEVDIDECALGTDGCSLQALCANTPGSYTCTCLSGYFGDGVTCDDTSYAVYTVVELPGVPRAAFWSDAYSGSLVSGALAASFAATVTASASSAPLAPFDIGIPALAALFAQTSVDPASTSTTRLEVFTLFPTLAAAQAAAATDAAALGVALSRAISATDTAVTVLQPLATRLQQATTFTSAVAIDGWGMNITAVRFNRTCTAQGQAPANGCWELELLYMGGMTDHGTQNVSQETLNVLYIPRIDSNPPLYAPLHPLQVITLQSASLFPCASDSSSTGATIARQATACCFRDVVSTYRTPSSFVDFLATALYSGQVPSGPCATPSALNQSFPPSEIIYQIPIADGGSNDMVVGPLDGMPQSEVRLLNVVDWTTRTFRVLLVLAQDDLLADASYVQGSANVAYNATFFVGLANFQPTGAASSVLQTRNMQQKVTVSKTNTLTLSSYGSNQDPLVNFATMQLVRVKVTDYFAAPVFLYYLQPVFTLPAGYYAPPSGPMVPLMGILVSKQIGGSSAGPPVWLQACASTDGTHIFANTTLQALVVAAQQQPCILSSLEMCTPPVQSGGVVQFGVPLPLGFVTDADFTDARGVTLQLQVMVTGYNPSTNEQTQTVLTMSLLLTPLGVTTVCSTLTQSQTLADIVQGDVYIGYAASNADWDQDVLKKLNFDSAGTLPADSLQFTTTTVQSSIMTFAAIGADSYFTDARATAYGLTINDLVTVHFLEPLGGNGATPNYDAVLAMFQAGTAFTTVSDASTGNAWLVPSAALLARCPYVPSYGHLACVTRIDSTIANNVLKRGPTLLELNTSDTSVVGLQSLMADVMYAGVPNDLSREMGTDFYSVLSSELGFNDRYKRAYVLNPVMKWSYQAMQAAQPMSTPYTVCTKIIALALVTFAGENGQPLHRRLLSVGQHRVPALTPHGRRRMPARPRRPTFAQIVAQSLVRGARPQRRKLLQLSATGQSIAPPASATQATDSLAVQTAIPGMDAVSTSCAIFGYPFARCAVLSLAQSAPLTPSSLRLCTSADPGADLQGVVSPALIGASTGITGAAVLQYSLTGCPTSSASAGRRLMQQGGTDMVATVTSVLVSTNSNGTVYIDLNAFNTAATLFVNSLSTTGKVLGGGIYITFAPPGTTGPVVLPPIIVVVSNTSYYLSVTPPPLIHHNASLPSSTVPAATPAYDLQLDTMFVQPRRSASDRLAVAGLNLVTAVALAATLAACYAS